MTTSSYSQTGRALVSGSEFTAGRSITSSRIAAMAAKLMGCAAALSMLCTPAQSQTLDQLNGHSFDNLGHLLAPSGVGVGPVVASIDCVVFFDNLLRDGCSSANLTIYDPENLHSLGSYSGKINPVVDVLSPLSSWASFVDPVGQVQYNFGYVGLMHSGSNEEEIPNFILRHGSNSSIGTFNTGPEFRTIDSFELFPESVAAVPEPAMYQLMLLALAGGLVSRLRRAHG